MLNINLIHDGEVNRIIYVRGKNLKKKSEVPFIPLLKSLLLAKKNAHKLPKKHQRKSHNLKQIRYHRSLKNYTFYYPWHYTDGRCVPRDTQIGKYFEAII